MARRICCNVFAHFIRICECAVRFFCFAFSDATYSCSWSFAMFGRVFLASMLMFWGFYFVVCVYICEWLFLFLCCHSDIQCANISSPVSPVLSGLLPNERAHKTSIPKTNHFVTTATVEMVYFVRCRKFVWFANLLPFMIIIFAAFLYVAGPNATERMLCASCSTRNIYWKFSFSFQK